MPTIDTLVNDIYAILDHEHKGVVSPDAVEAFAQAATSSLHRTIESPERGPRDEGVIYASELRDFEVCPRKMWYKIHMPDTAETLLPHNRIKFLYGDMTEAMLVFLAEQAGHHVTGIQESVTKEYDNGITIRGRMDAIIDGVVIDVKSASSPAFKRMTSPDYDFYSDMFSYHRQLQFYDGGMTHGNETDPALLIMDKQLGVLALKSVPSWDTLSHSALSVEFQSIADTARYVFDAEHAPSILKSQWVGEEDTTNGNKKAKTYCSYCAFKTQCWEDHGKPLQGYLYSHGPVWLTEVNKEPKNQRIY